MMRKIFWLVLIAGFAWSEQVNAAGPVVVAGSFDSPVLDGNAAKWSAIQAVRVKVTPAVAKDDRNYTGDVEVAVKAATSSDTIYILLQWPDDTRDATHKTLTWNKEKDAYDTGEDLEDRIALSFDMAGDYMGCMLAGTEYQADVWHWKAFRSQTAGIAHDKMHIVSYHFIPKAKQHKGRNGKDVWVARPSDAGDTLYKSQRLIDKKGETEPKYIVNTTVQGSVADVKTAAVWENSTWTVEMQRKLDTGNTDDVKFEKGKSYQAGMAVFNHTGDDHHSTVPFVLEIR